MAAPATTRVFNVNIGFLGHVDSGKTSLSKALSQIASTASFDKNPQSQERGITLDLGFSAFFAPSTPQFVKDAGYDELQFTIVDCPGHASLIKTVIGGASIIDMLVLVVDATKGFQTQTAEGLVIGEITCGVMLVALNKIDLLAADERDGLVARLTKRIRATMARTRFPHAPVIPVATRGGGESASEPINLQALVAALVERVSLPSREPSADTFLLQADHCFAVRGQGTVLTGTVQRGSVSVGQMVELPSLLVRKKVKSIQMFRKPVQLACRGDRIGLCLAGLEASSFERGIVAAPGTVPTVEAVIVRAERVRYFKGDVASRVKYHLTIGHSTVLAVPQFFRLPDDAPPGLDPACFSLGNEYIEVETLPEYADAADGLADAEEASSAREAAREAAGAFATPAPGPARAPGVCWALLELERRILCPDDSLCIASHMDADLTANTCRLAFSGRVSAPFVLADKAALRIFRRKHKVCNVVRAKDANTIIVKGLFPPGTPPEVFLGLVLQTENGSHRGVVTGTFGASNKLVVSFADGIPAERVAHLHMHYKKYLYDTTHSGVHQ